MKNSRDEKQKKIFKIAFSALIHCFFYHCRLILVILPFFVNGKVIIIINYIIVIYNSNCFVLFSFFLKTIIS